MKWTPEAEAALQDLKRYLSSTPILVAPKPQEPLLLYLAAMNQLVSAALVVQREVNEGAVAVARVSDNEPELPWQGLVPARQDPWQSLASARQEPRQNLAPARHDLDQ